MEAKKMEKEGIVEGKVDWKGRPAIKGIHGGSSSSLPVLALFGFDSFATLALAVNLVTYFITVMHFDLASASTVLTNFMGTIHILAIVVAYFADTFVGRHKAALIAACIEFLGLVLLTTQAHIPSLKPPLCNIFDPTAHCERIKGENSVLFYLSLYLIAIGMAGIRAGLPSHGADQFAENDPQEAMMMSSFFNWILLSICIGGALSLVFLVWIQNKVGWDWGFAVSTIGIFLGILVFAAGVPRYRIHVSNGTNPMTEIIQVFVASIHNRKLQLPENPEELYEIIPDKESAVEFDYVPHREVYRFLDKAAIQTRMVHPGSIEQQAPSSWKLCRVTQVENAKTIIGMLPIFGSTIIMSTCLAQLQTFSIQQGATMNTRIIKSFKIPPASIPIIPVSFLIILVPIYDRIIVPFVRKFTGHSTGITHLQRIGIGLVFSFISMSIAAIVEVKRKKVAESHGMLDVSPLVMPLPISIFWLGFQFFIFGIADMFTYVGLLEFFYSEAPKKLKSMATCLLWFSVGLGYFVSTVLVKLVNLATKNDTKSGGWLAGNNLNRNDLNLFYWLLAILSFINFANYLFWARRYKYKSRSHIAPNKNGGD